MIVVGDLILNNIVEKLLTTKNKYVKVYALSGATTTELVAFIRPLANTKLGKTNESISSQDTSKDETTS